MGSCYPDIAFFLLRDLLQALSEILRKENSGSLPSSVPWSNSEYLASGYVVLGIVKAGLLCNCFCCTHFNPLCKIRVDFSYTYALPVFNDTLLQPFRKSLGLGYNSYGTPYTASFYFLCSSLFLSHRETFQLLVGHWMRLVPNCQFRTYWGVSYSLPFNSVRNKTFLVCSA